MRLGMRQRKVPRAGPFSFWHSTSLSPLEGVLQVCCICLNYSAFCALAVVTAIWACVQSLYTIVRFGHISSWSSPFWSASDVFHDKWHWDSTCTQRQSYRRSWIWQSAYTLRAEVFWIPVSHWRCSSSCSEIFQWALAEWLVLHVWRRSGAEKEHAWVILIALWLNLCCICLTVKLCVLKHWLTGEYRPKTIINRVTCSNKLL